MAISIKVRRAPLSAVTCASRRACAPSSSIGSQPRYTTTYSAELRAEKAAIKATRCKDRKEAASAPTNIKPTVPKKAPQKAMAISCMGDHHTSHAPDVAEGL